MYATTRDGYEFNLAQYLRRSPAPRWFPPAKDKPQVRRHQPNHAPRWHWRVKSRDGWHRAWNDGPMEPALRLWWQSHMHRPGNAIALAIGQGTGRDCRIIAETTADGRIALRTIQEAAGEANTEHLPIILPEGATKASVRQARALERQPNSDDTAAISETPIEELATLAGNLERANGLTVTATGDQALRWNMRLEKPHKYYDTTTLRARTFHG